MKSKDTRVLKLETGISKFLGEIMFEATFLIILFTCIFLVLIQKLGNWLKLYIIQL